LKEDNFGDYKSISAALWELRITTGPGYRVYYTKKGDEIIILLVGGDKSSQSDDIKKAKKLLEEINYE
jgi:putative addiction module killer protein